MKNFTLANFARAATVTGAVLTLTLIFAVGCKPKPQTTEQKTIKVGALLPLTGPAASTGEQLRKAILLALKETNSNGNPIEVVFEDSQNDPAKGVAAFQKMATVDKVSSVIVSLSSISQAVAPIANSSHLPIFTLASTPIQAAPNEFAFRYFIDGAGEARLMANYLVKKGYKRIAVVQINDDYGRILAEEFSKALKTANLEPVIVESLERKSDDFRPSAFRIKEKNPDAVYFVAYARPLGIALKQTREAGITVPFATTFGLEIQGTRELAGPGAEGIVYTGVPFGEGTTESEATRAFTQQFKTEYSVPPASDAAIAYDLIKILRKHGAEIVASPGSFRGKTIETQFGEVRITDHLEILPPLVLKQIENDVVHQITQ
jgi:branched-chain amino acid transport system substrate-binding protein